jgi:uncharacterized protein (TIGR02186 family)
MSRSASMAARLCALALVALLAGVALLSAGAARGQALIADLSSHLIAINADFKGTDVTLFGAVSGEGQVAVVVRGPDIAITARRKERIVGIWANVAEARFLRAPSFYGVASSIPLEEAASKAALDRYEIGLEHLRMPTRERLDLATERDFRAALIRAKQREGLYTQAPGEVTFLGQRLFRAKLHLPANVMTGAYTVRVFLIKDGEVTSAQTTPLIVSKVGFSAGVFEFAKRSAWLYAILGIGLAALGGWLANALLRRP